jgi:hypothetical protein
MFIITAVSTLDVKWHCARDSKFVIDKDCIVRIILVAITELSLKNMFWTLAHRYDV